MTTGSKKKTVKCAECGKDVEIGLYEKKIQYCATCQKDPDNAVITSIARETIKDEAAEFDRTNGETYGTRVRRLMSSLGFTPRPSSAGSVEYYRDYGDKNSMRTRVTTMFSRGVHGMGLDQGKLEGFCITTQIYVHAAHETIRDLIPEVAMPDVETTFAELGIQSDIHDINTIDSFECEYEGCDIVSDEMFDFKGKKLCQEHFQETIDNITPDQAG